MATRMANTSQGIVLGVKVDKAAAGATDRFERSIQSVCMTGNGEPLLFEEVTDGVVGFVLFVRCFRVGPDLPAML